MFYFLSYLRLMQFSYTEIGNFHDDPLSLNEIGNFDTPRWKLSRRFYSFDRVTSFVYRDTQVSRRFYDLNKIRNFYLVDILHFPGTL